MGITQSDFDFLIKLKKKFSDEKEILLGPAPMKWSRDIVSLETRDIFILDYYRGQLNINKYSYNKRYRTNIVLIRVCSRGRHHNPDGTVINGLHLHLYTEAYEDRMAVPIDILGISNSASIDEVLQALLKYCNVINIPVIQNSIQ